MNFMDGLKQMNNNFEMEVLEHEVDRLWKKINDLRFLLFELKQNSNISVDEITSVIERELIKI